MNPERNLGFFPRVPASKRWRERENRKKKDEKGKSHGRRKKKRVEQLVEPPSKSVTQHNAPAQSVLVKRLLAYAGPLIASESSTKAMNTIASREYRQEKLQASKGTFMWCIQDLPGTNRLTYADRE